MLFGSSPFSASPFSASGDAGVAYVSEITEIAAAVEQLIANIAASASTAEAGSASDSSIPSIALSIAEAGLAEEIQGASIAADVAAEEQAGTPAEDSSVEATLFAGVEEGVTAGETSALTLQGTPVQNEAVNAQEIASAGVTVHMGEGATASDAQRAALSLEIEESFSVADFPFAVATLHPYITEQAAAIEQSESVHTASVLTLERVMTTDTSDASLFALAQVIEQAVATVANSVLRELDAGVVELVAAGELSETLVQNLASILETCEANSTQELPVFKVSDRFIAYAMLERRTAQGVDREFTATTAPSPQTATKEAGNYTASAAPKLYVSRYE